MLRWAVAFCVGVAAMQALPVLWPVAATGVLAAVAVAFARKLPLFAAALAGFAWALLCASASLATGWPCARDREAATVTGRIAAPPLERAGRVDFDLEEIGMDVPGPTLRRLRVSWYDADILPHAGELWRVDLKLRCRRGLANPGAPARELALLRERIDATAYVAGKSRPERLSAPAARSLARLRARIAGAISAALPPGPTVAVLQGLAVGLRGTIPDSLWESFSVTGIAHLIAISGLHVTGCAIFVLALLRLACRLPLFARVAARPAVECVVVAGTTAFYAFLSGGSLPALRTLAMVAILAALRVLRRCWPLHQSLALAAVLLVAAEPLALSSAGFWLSFVATAALLAVVTGEPGWRGRLAGFGRGQVAVTALLAPVLALSFGRISMVSPLVNAIAIPVFSVLLLPTVLAATAMSAFAPEAAGGLWNALAFLLDGVWPLLEAIATWRGASWSPALQPAALVAATAALAFVGLLVPLAGLRIAAAVLLVAIGLGRVGAIRAGAFALTAVDIGQGLAVVIETARHSLVFDSGPRWQGGGAAAQVSLLPYLRARGLRRVDRLVLSHDDLDHTGGADSLRRSLRVGVTMAAPGSQFVAQETCRRGGSWNWDGVAFRVLHPPEGYGGGDNARSCAIVVSGPGGSALLLADVEAAAEAELISQATAADVVLLPHHGRRSSSSPALVAAAAARYGIASAGFGNRWGMPDAGVVARWRASGATVLVTAAEGAVHARFPPRPGRIEIGAERRDAPHWWRPTPAG
jgi:competence protein ComEC